MWDLIVWLVLGAIVGWLASITVGRNKEMGCLANAVVGILSAVVGGAIVRFLGLGGPRVVGLNLYSLVVGVLGAVLLLLGLGLFKKQGD